MKVFFLLTQNKHLDTRIADGTVLGQILAQALPYASGGSVIVTAGNVSAASENQLVFVQNQNRVELDSATGNLAALRACRERGLIPQAEACLVVTDGSIVIHNYDKLASDQSAGIVSLMNRAFWFRNGADLDKLLDWQSDRPIETVQVRPEKVVSVGDVDELVLANRRLLGIGYASKDALERSYTEEFGVIPPVFIHAEAEIYSSMIGPYVSIGAGAHVENCVLENCIIDDGAHVSNLNLRDSIVGRDQKIVGTAQTIIKI